MGFSTFLHRSSLHNTYYTYYAVGRKKGRAMLEFAPRVYVRTRLFGHCLHLRLLRVFIASRLTGSLRVQLRQPDAGFGRHGLGLLIS